MNWLVICPNAMSLTPYVAEIKSARESLTCLIQVYVAGALSMPTRFFRIFQ